MPRNKLHEPDKQDADDNVKVVVRCRPLNKKEIEEGHKQSIIMDEIRGTITVTKLKTPQEQPRTFTYDTVFGPNSKQLDIYNLTARPIVDSVLEGYNDKKLAAELEEKKKIEKAGKKQKKAEQDYLKKEYELKKYKLEQDIKLANEERKEKMKAVDPTDLLSNFRPSQKLRTAKAINRQQLFHALHELRRTQITYFEISDDESEQGRKKRVSYLKTQRISSPSKDTTASDLCDNKLSDSSISQYIDDDDPFSRQSNDETKVEANVTKVDQYSYSDDFCENGEDLLSDSKPSKKLSKSKASNGNQLFQATNELKKSKINGFEISDNESKQGRKKRVSNLKTQRIRSPSKDTTASELCDNKLSDSTISRYIDDDDPFSRQSNDETKVEANVTKVDQYSYSDDFCENGEGLLSNFRPSQKLRTAKASNRQQLFHALHERRRTQITYFEISDDESEQGRKKSISYLKTQRISSPSEDTTASDLCDNKLSDSSISQYIDDDDPFSRQSNDETKVEANVTKVDQYSYSDDFCENGEGLLSDSKPSKKLSKSKASNRNQLFQATNELKKSKINGFEISDNESKKGRKKRVSNLKTQRIRSPSEDTTASELCDNKLSDSSISRYIDDDDPFSRQSNDETKVEANVTKVDQYSYSDDFCENGEDLLSDSKPSKKLSKSKASNGNQLFQAKNELKKSKINGFEISDNESKQGRKKSVSNLKTQRIRSPSKDTTASELCDNKLSDSTISQYIDDDDPFSRQSNDETKVEANVTKVDQYSYSDDFCENGEDLLSDSKPSKKLSKSKASNRNQLFQATNELKKSKINGFEISDNESKQGRKKSVSNLKTQRISSPSEDTTASDLCDNKLSDSSISRYIDDDDPFSRQSNDETKVEANVTKVDQYSYSDDFCENGEDLLSDSKPSKKLSKSKASNRNQLFQATNELKKSKINGFEISDNESKKGRKKRVSNLKTQMIRSPSEDTTASELCDNKLSDSSISRYIDDDDPFSRQSNDETKVEANVTKVDQYSYSDDFCENGEGLLSNFRPSQKLRTAKASNRQQLFHALHERRRTQITYFEISDDESEQGRKKSISYLKTQRISSPSEDTTASDLCDNKLSDSSISQYIDDDDPFSRQSNDETKVEANVTKVDQYSYSDDFCENGEGLLSDSKPSKKLSKSKASNRNQLFQATNELKKSKINGFEISDNESKKGRKKRVSNLKTQRIRSPSEDTTASELCDNKLSDSSISRYIDDDDPFSRQSNDETKVEANVTKVDQYSYSDDFCENGEGLLSNFRPSQKLRTAKASNRQQLFHALHERKRTQITYFEISDDESEQGRKKSISYLKTQRISSPSEDTTASDLCENKLSDSSISQYIDDDDPFSRQSNDETKVEANVTKVDQYSYSDDFCENGEDLLSDSKPSKKLSKSKASNGNQLFQATNELKKSKINGFEISDNESKQGRKKSVSNLKTQRIRSPSKDTTASELCDNKLSDSSISRYIDDDDPFSRQSNDETKVEANVTKVDQYSYSDDFCENGEDLLSDSKPSKKLSKSKASNGNQLFQATNELNKSKINGFEISDNESKQGRKKSVSNLKTQRIRSPSEDTTASDLCDNKLSDSTISRYIDDDDPFSRQSNDETKVEANVTKVDQYSYSDDFCENGEGLLSDSKPSKKLSKSKASNGNQLFQAKNELKKSKINGFEISDNESKKGRKKRVSNLKTQRIRSPSEDTTASDLCDNKLSDSTISRYIDDDDPFSRQSNDETKVEANVTKVDQYSYSDDFCENGEDLLSDSKPSKKLSKSKASNGNQLFQATNELKKSKINGFEISDNESKQGRKKSVSNLKTQRIRSPSEDTTASDLCDNKLSDSTISRYIDDDDPFSRQSNDETKVEANVTKVDQYSYSDDFCENGEDLLSDSKPSKKLSKSKASNGNQLFQATNELKKSKINGFEISDNESKQGRKKSVSNLKTQRIRSPSKDTTASELCDNKLSDSSISRYIDDDDPFSRQSNDETKVEANVTKVDQYSYSDDFCENGEDLLSDSKPSKKLSKSKASNGNQLFQATNELNKSKINGFEISDNESKQGRKKSVSNLKTQRIRSPSEDTTASDLCDNKLSDSTISRYIDDDDPFSRQSNDETKVEANVTKVDQYSYSDDFCENGEGLLSDSKPSKKLSKSKASNGNQLFQAKNELKKSKINGFEISDNESKKGRKKRVSNLKTQRIRSPSEDTTASDLCDNKLSDSTISRYIDDDDPFSRQSNDETKVEANVTKVDQYSYSDDFCENGEDLLSDSKPSKKLSKSKASNGNQLFQATNELKKSKINGFEISDNESKQGRKKSVSNLKTQRIRSPSEDTTASDLCDNKLSDSTISRYIDDDDPFSRQSNDETKVEANVTKVDQYSYSDDFCENGEDLLSDSKPSKKLSKSKASNRNQLFQAKNELKKSKINGFEISDNESKQGRKKSVSNLKTQRIRSPSKDTTASELCDNKLSDSTISQYIDDDDPFSRQSNDETKVEANVTKVDQYSYSDDFCENGEDLLSDSKPSKKLSKSKASNGNQLFQAKNELKKSKINGFEISDNESKQGRKKRVSNLKTQRIISSSEDTKVSDLRENRLSDTSVSRYDEDSSSTQHTKDKTQFKNRDGESALPCENNMMKPQGPAKKSNSFQVEHFRTPLLSATDFRLMSPAGNATEKKPPRPKSRQGTLGLSHQATEKIVRDLSRPQTSSASIPPSIDSSSNTAIRKSSPNNIGADPDQLSRGHEQLFDTRTTSSHSKTSKRPQVVHSRKVESKYFRSLEFLDEKVSLHESQAKSVNSLRVTNYQAWIKKKQEELRENKKKERILKEVKKKEEEARKEKAAAAFEEWEKKKVEGLKAKVKKPRARQSTEQDEEVESKKSAAALERWIKLKMECLKAQAEERQDMIRQEQRLIEEEEEERQSAGKTFEILKREHDYLLKETYRKQREDENYRLLIEHEEESIRKRKSERAFSDWCKKKRDELREKVTMERRAAEDKAEEERLLKAKKNRIALEAYEKWRARKARERRIQLEERQRPAVLRGSPRPPWIPPGNTIPFRSKRMQNIQFTSNY